MTRIRKLWFQNAAGERWGLNGQQGIYASELAGLGLSLSPEFADLSRGFFLPVQEENEPQTAVSFTLTFAREPYKTYKRLVDWLAAAGKVTLIYQPTGEKEYCREVIVTGMQKGELNAVGWLQVPCSILCLTPWYLPLPTSLQLETDADENVKRYTYTYTPQLRYGSDAHASLAAPVAGSGHIPGALELTYTGAVTNPRFRLVGNNSGKLCGTCSVQVTLGEADSLVFSTRYEESFVKKISASGAETDLLDVLDLSSDPFFHIPVTEACTLYMESDAEISGSAQLQVFYYFRSV